MMNKYNLSRRDWLITSSLISLGMGMPKLYSTGNNADRDSKSGIPSEEVVRLLYNENPNGPTEAVKSIISNVVNRSNRYATFYEHDYLKLKELIARQEGLKPENVLLGHGSFELLIWLATHYGSKGEEIVVPSPTFDVVGLFARKIGAEVIPVEVDKDYLLDLERMEGSLSPRTSLLTVCNPNNPTGTKIDTDDLKRFAKLISSRCPVLVDEAYIHYLNNWRKHTMSPLIAEGKNILITRTFSKIYGMAGLRVGILLGPEHIISDLESKFTLGFPGNMPNSLSMAAAIAALNDGPFLETSRKYNNEVRAHFNSGLHGLNINSVPSETNFVYFDVENFPAFKALMWKDKILLAGGWPSKPNWARLTMGTKEEIDFILNKMKGKKWM